MKKEMENLAWFTEEMREIFLMAKKDERKASAENLNVFLGKISRGDLEEITSGSDRGADLLVVKDDPAFAYGFVDLIDTDKGFSKWISMYSRTWKLLN